MRNATHDVKWIEDENRLVGISLGYDFCAEHEFGVQTIREGLGISGGLGVEGRTATKQPEVFRFELYDHQVKKKRGTRKEPPVWPAAILHIAAFSSPWMNNQTVEELVKLGEANFHTGPFDDWYKPERDDIRVSWDEAEVLINVRGAENVAKLTELVELFRKNDLSLAEPGGGLFARTGLSLVAPSRMTAEEKKEVLDRDLEYERLLKAAADTGIEKRLKNAGFRYYALNPGWANEEKTEVRFFLNPLEQTKNKSGWFTTNELDEWIAGKGPVLKEGQPAKTRNLGPR